MNLQALTSIRDLAWLYAAGPLLLIAALLLTARLKAPQWRRLPDAFRALREPGNAGEGAPPGLATALAARCQTCPQNELKPSQAMARG